MNRQDQRAFIKDLSDDIVMEILNMIDDEKIPENWDGIELRWFLKEKFERAANFGNANRKRKYNNAVVVNNL